LCRCGKGGCGGGEHNATTLPLDSVGGLAIEFRRISALAVTIRTRDEAALRKRSRLQNGGGSTDCSTTLDVLRGNAAAAAAKMTASQRASAGLRDDLAPQAAGVIKQTADAAFKVI